MVRAARVLRVQYLLRVLGAVRAFVLGFFLDGGWRERDFDFDSKDEVV